MSDQTHPTPSDNKIIFANVRDLARYLDISDRRLRQYKQSGRLNYTTDAVLVDRKELSALKQNMAAYQLARYVPHRFRLRRGHRKSYRHPRKEREGGARDLQDHSLYREAGTTAKRELEKRTPVEPSSSQSSDGRIQELMSTYGLSREEALRAARDLPSSWFDTVRVRTEA